MHIPKGKVYIDPKNVQESHCYYIHIHNIVGTLPKNEVNEMKSLLCPPKKKDTHSSVAAGDLTLSSELKTLTSHKYI